MALECDRIKLTREQMAERLSIDSAYLAQLENGRRSVDDWYLCRAKELRRESERIHQ
jgi:transcriptional regulator with XRE-family HTH domain